MTENSKIEWCDHTFNPWMGCAKVAPGCAHCYAEALMDTRYGTVKWGEHGTRVKTSKANWNKVRKWNREAQCSCGAAGAFGRECAWCADGGKTPRVFCASLADVAEDRPELVPWRAELCDLIRECENLDFLLLTKRPENLTRLFPRDVLERCWNGTSISGQPTADRNIPRILNVPSAKRFVIAEPLIGPVSLRDVPQACPRCGEWRMRSVMASDNSYWERDYCDACHSSWMIAPALDDCADKDRPAPTLDWLIIGGESGPNARPCDVAWIRSIVEQCKAAGVPVFVKQLGAAPFALVENYACEDDTCQRCGGRGEIVTCLDDLCYGQDECIHGDGYGTCPDCGGCGHEDTRIREPLKLRDRKGANPSEWPADLRVREFPEAK